MRLSRLRLSNFRNLAEVELEVPPGVSVYFGQNAQGKTALVEAVYLLAIARSFRAENERELVNFDAAREGGQALVDGMVEYDGPEGQVHPHPNPPPQGGGSVVGGEGTLGRRRVIIGYRASPSAAASGPGYRVHKEIRVDRMRRTATSLVGLVHAVLFSVQDIGLVQGPPSARRRFLDILISQADPLYLQGLQRYQRVLQQRNRLLRMRREGRARPDEMEFWDDELVQEGAWLTWRRHEVMDILTPACIRHHRDLGGGETLVLRYRPSVPLSARADGMTGSYREALQAVAGRERATAATAAGPHRDDFDIIVNGVDMGAFASRGQARTLALALRLAEAETLSAVRGTRPLLLLDDALSEMDADRRRRVLEKTTDYPQVMITTTDVEQVSGYFGASAAYFRVDEGRIMPCDLLEMGEK